MTNAWWPQATPRPVSYAGDAGKMTKPVRGWVLHVTVMNGSPWSTFEHAPASNRRFSHLWVAKDGHAEQYAPLDQKSWAQVDGNADWWSVETDGAPSEPLTDAQIATLAAFHVWALAPDDIAVTPNGYGIGTHYMGGASWGGHTCPDSVPGQGPRSLQRQAIIDAAIQIRKGTAVLTQDDLNNVAAIVWSARFGASPTTGTMMQNIANRPQFDATAIAKAIAAAMPAPTIDVAALAKATAAAVVAALPPAPAGGLTAADVEAAMTRVLTKTHLTVQ